MKEVFEFIYAASLGAWVTSLFVLNFYDISIPMWVSLVVMCISAILQDFTE